MVARKNGRGLLQLSLTRFTCARAIGHLNSATPVYTGRSCKGNVVVCTESSFSQFCFSKKTVISIQVLVFFLGAPRAYIYIHASLLKYQSIFRRDGNRIEMTSNSDSIRSASIICEAAWRDVSSRDANYASEYVIKDKQKLQNGKTRNGGRDLRTFVL